MAVDDVEGMQRCDSASVSDANTTAAPEISGLSHQKRIPPRKVGQLDTTTNGWESWDDEFRIYDPSIRDSTRDRGPDFPPPLLLPLAPHDVNGIDRRVDAAAAAAAWLRPRSLKLLIGQKGFGTNCVVRG